VGAYALHHEYARERDSRPCARVHVRAYYLYGNTFGFTSSFIFDNLVS
jgi:hypothetical protein